jgi:hypothetical protein
MINNEEYIRKAEAAFFLIGYMLGFITTIRKLLIDEKPINMEEFNKDYNYLEESINNVFYCNKPMTEPPK